jgi:hypothetical protein
VLTLLSGSMSSKGVTKYWQKLADPVVDEHPMHSSSQKLGRLNGRTLPVHGIKGTNLEGSCPNSNVKMHLLGSLRYEVMF